MQSSNNAAEQLACNRFDELLKKSPCAIFEQHKSIILEAFSLSDFISRIAIHYPQEFSELLPDLVAQVNSSQPDYHYQTYRQTLYDQLATAELESQLHHRLRKFRHLSMLRIAFIDMVLNGNIENSLNAISELAIVCINSAYDWLYKKACERYGSPQNNQDMLILGMGKLGGNELNFSSDIDLIFVYPSHGETNHARKPIEHKVFFTKLAQRLIASLHQITADGQAYRVDMRLRPLGESGPLVISMAAFATYYQEQGREWERFAMQKAKVLNYPSTSNQADIAELNDTIQPYVYRKYLDFTTLESLRNMKHLIETEVKRRHLQGNIKLGKGGIREVEFYIQCHQLIHAGKITECQTTSILSAFAALCQHGLIEAEIATSLQQNYLNLRKVEHYLQAFDDKQTQTLPTNKTDQMRLCKLLNQASYQDVLALVETWTGEINQNFSDLISQSDDSDTGAEHEDSIFRDLWLLALSQVEVLHLLQTKISHADVTPIANEILIFKGTMNKAAQTDRSKSTLDKLIPYLLEQILDDPVQCDKNSRTSPVALIARVFGIVEKLVGRTTYLDLMLENKLVRTRLIDLCSKSNWIAAQISRFPLLLDELLHPAYLTSDQHNIAYWRTEYQDALRMMLLRIDPSDAEAQLDALRSFKLTQQLRIAAADASGTLAINKVSDKLTLLAEVILDSVVDMAWAQMTEKFGMPANTDMDNKGFAVIAYGKMGGWEMGYGSDIDIVCLHACDTTKTTNGNKKISNTEFFVKLVQRVSHIFTTNTYLGQLYEIDLRLRPSGNSGLLISHIDSFDEYQHQQAWTWEHQALTRSRCVYGTESIKQKFNDIRKSVLGIKRDAVLLKNEVASMRTKMRQHLDKTGDDGVDLKQTHGGITDLEFLVQFHVLKHANTCPELCTWSDNLRSLDSLATLNLISDEQSQALQSAYLELRHKLHKLSLEGLTLAASTPNISAQLSCINDAYNNLLGNTQ